MGLFGNIYIANLALELRLDVRDSSYPLCDNKHTVFISLILFTPHNFTLGALLIQY